MLTLEFSPMHLCVEAQPLRDSSLALASLSCLRDGFSFLIFYIVLFPLSVTFLQLHPGM